MTNIIPVMKFIIKTKICPFVGDVKKKEKKYIIGRNANPYINNNNKNIAHLSFSITI